MRKFSSRLRLLAVLLLPLLMVAGCNQSMMSSLESVTEKDAENLQLKKQQLMAEIAADPLMQKVTGGRTDDPAPGFGVVVGGSEQDFILNVGEVVYFVDSSGQLERTAKDTLNMQAQWLQRYPQWKLALQGHADDPIPVLPPKEPDKKGLFHFKRDPKPETIKTAEQNRGQNYLYGLSDRRAQAVRDYLIERGIAPERLEAQGYGDLVKVRDCPETNCASMNRRVVSSLKKSFSPVPEPQMVQPASPAMTEEVQQQIQQQAGQSVAPNKGNGVLPPDSNSSFEPVSPSPNASSNSSSSTLLAPGGAKKKGLIVGQ